MWFISNRWKMKQVVKPKDGLQKKQHHQVA